MHRIYSESGRTPVSHAALVMLEAPRNQHLNITDDMPRCLSSQGVGAHEVPAILSRSIIFKFPKSRARVAEALRSTS